MTHINILRPQETSVTYKGKDLAVQVEADKIVIIGVGTYDSYSKLEETAKKHVCGLQGFGALDDICLACDDTQFKSQAIQFVLEELKQQEIIEERKETSRYKNKTDFFEKTKNYIPHAQLIGRSPYDLSMQRKIIKKF